MPWVMALTSSSSPVRCRTEKSGREVVVICSMRLPPCQQVKNSRHSHYSNRIGACRCMHGSVRRVTLLFVYGVHGIAVNDGATVHALSPANFTRPAGQTYFAVCMSVTKRNAVLS